MIKDGIVLLCILIVLMAVYFAIREIRRKLQGKNCSGCGGCERCGGAACGREKNASVKEKERNAPM